MLMLAVLVAIVISAGIVLFERRPKVRKPLVLPGVEARQIAAATGTQAFEEPPGREQVLKDNLRVPLLIDYRDAKGEPTRRTVVVHQVVGLRRRDGSTEAKRLNAYCLTRRGPRQFLISRIVAAANPETGEVIETLKL